MADQSEDKLTQSEIAAISAAVAENRGWFIALGVVLVVLGAVSIASPLMTTLAVKILLGWLFLIAGVAQVIHAFSAKSWKGFFGDLLIGLLYAAIGAWLAFFPLTGIIGLTALLAIMFIAEGVVKFGLGFQIRPLDGWFWMVLSGVIAIVAGGMIFMGLPSTATWAIGLLVGINLVMSGWSFLMMSLFARKAV